MSRFIKFVLVLLFPVLLIVVSTAVLMADPGDEPFPTRKPISEDAASSLAQAPASTDGSGIVQDGGFESGTPNASWDEFSSNFPSPICNASCTIGGVTNLAHSGSYWAWFGGIADERGTLTQTVTIPNVATAQLKFFLRYGSREAGALGNDYLRVFMDGNQLFQITDSQADFNTYGGSDYTEVTLNINSYADGLVHTLVFDSYIGTGEGIDDFLVDDVSISTSTMAEVFLPTIMNNYCFPPSYSDFVDYDMNIIDAPEMWGNIGGFCKPGEGVVVAVIDTGVDLDHPDLLANLVPGATFISGTSTPDDDEGHGTHVAGSVAAAMNDVGMIGVAPFAKIMPVKVLSASGSGTVSGVAAGIRWAADNGAKVINLSLGGSSFTSVQQDAVNYATAKGVLVIAAAGNCGHPVGWQANNCPGWNSISYPAAFDNAMAVASTANFDVHSTFSTQASYVEIAAPGSSIYSTVPGGGYGTASGTSQAAPHVAGLAAAIWSRNPSLTNTQVRQILNSTAVDLGAPGRDIYFGYGRIQALDAVLQSLNVTSLSDLSPVPMGEVETAVIDPNAPFVPGEVIVKLDSVFAQSADEIEALDLGIASADVTITRVEAIDAYIMHVPVGEELAYIEQLNNLDGVEYAEPNYIVTMQ